MSTSPATRPFAPIRTLRLAIRPFRPEDAEDLAARRSDPAVARYQNWIAPFSLKDARELVAGLVAMDGPTNEEWWMAVVEDGETGEPLGDLVVHLESESRTAEVGYSLHSRHWGQGYAVEALDGLLDHLFEDVGITRAFGMLHPDNRASAQVLERTGFVFEGHTRASFWLAGENSDDWIYGMTRQDWDDWRARPRDPPTEMALVEVTAENANAVRALRSHHSQRAFVAPVEASFADALFPEVVNGAPVVPWLRAIEADGELAAFVMVAQQTHHHPEPYLWRFLVDRRHQRRGVGSRALELVIAHFRDAGATGLLTSWVPGRGSPEAFWLRHGFTPTGKEQGGETEGRLDLLA